MNKRIEKLEANILSNKTFLLKEYTFEYRHTDTHPSEKHLREVYDHGDGASVLLYNLIKKTVVLTRQFRLPTFLNGNTSGMSIEVCAGSLDGDTPEVCAKKEALEETGYAVNSVEKVFSVYASPATMTEIAHLFIAEYTDEMKVENGGGLDEEEEYIDVLEIEFRKAFNMIQTGEIKDARTVMLLQFLKIKDTMES
ncbi:nudix-type nucleoside diphosphatase, YffH/AdpP family [Aquimarina amphilecti]|uniref:GDP-mannose pyrophosphatase n=1 Tax=Aquimarina amphilecti TaxID=1038014 RepID=A0A1H7UYW7_AQUAM|nr:NUDIX domain-containing protein [Aquimarina amphilecti]SEM01845.1 nudix-type nucleoside diphosphatase, YffH/AdpP family [Aquimarina amphilecti]